MTCSCMGMLKMNFFLLAVVLLCQGFAMSINKDFTELFQWWPHILQRLSRKNVTQVGQEFIHLILQPNAMSTHRRISHPAFIYVKVVPSSKPRGTKCEAWLRLSKSNLDKCQLHKEKVAITSKKYST